MRHGAGVGLADDMRIFGEQSSLVARCGRDPRGAAMRELVLLDQHIDALLVGIDADAIAVLDERERATDRGLGRDVTDADAARRAGEAAVGDQRVQPG